MTEKLSAGGTDLESDMKARLSKAPPRNTREMFLELNPHLSEDKIFLDRYEERKEAAVLVPVINRPEPTVLLTVRSQDMPSHAGQISFPGGRVHTDDPSHEHTALRETHEEVGIPPNAVKIMGDLGVHVGGKGYNVTPYVGIVDASVAFHACPREVQEIFEVPLRFLLDISNHRTEEKSFRETKFRMFAVPWNEYHIWWLTAGILRSFAERMVTIR